MKDLSAPTGSTSSSSNGHPSAHHQGGSTVTGAQLTSVALLTVLALALSIALPATRYNLGLSAHDVGPAIMPPGMIMTRDTSAEAMRDMSAVDPDSITQVAPASAVGDQAQAPRVTGGVKVFSLSASVVGWQILPGIDVAAYAFDGQVPGPRLRVTEGDRVRVQVTNRLPEPTSVHWHGLVLPNRMDGAADVTQEPIGPGETFTYAFKALRPGTYFYHSHAAADRQQGLGLYGALIVDPADPSAEPRYEHEMVVQLQEWLRADGLTFPAMQMAGALPNYFTLNGKAYPATETTTVRVGERIRIRFLGTQNNFVHPMHVHGGPFRIVATDGEPVPVAAQLLKDTVNIGPGERYDVIWKARRTGRWLLHCHIPHHTTNDNVEQAGGGGLMAVIEVVP